MGSTVGAWAARPNWLTWAICTLEFDAGQDARQFGRALHADYGRFLWLLRATGMAHRVGANHRVTERGAIWVHRMQSLFSLSGIDNVWTACSTDAWPETVPIF